MPGMGTAGPAVGMGRPRRWRLNAGDEFVVDEQFRTLAYVSLRDDAVRARVLATLDAAGWTAIEQPTGYHVLRSIADVIEGAQSGSRPALIVIDAFARGCAGTTIALG